MKKGISLIVLVITIVIIIILAGAVILNLAGNNPISQASAAAVLSEEGDINSAITNYGSTLMGKYYEGIYYTVKESATQIDPKALDANNAEIGSGYYELADIEASCGTEFSDTNVFPGTVDNLIDKVGIKNSRYAKNTSSWKTVMNDSGHIKLVKLDKSGNVVVATTTGD